MDALDEKKEMALQKLYKIFEPFLEKVSILKKHTRGLMNRRCN